MGWDEERAHGEVGMCVDRAVVLELEDRRVGKWIWFCATVAMRKGLN